VKFPFSHGKERRDRRYSTDSGDSQQQDDKKTGSKNAKNKSAKRMLAFAKKDENNSLERTPPTGIDLLFIL